MNGIELVIRDKFMDQQLPKQPFERISDLETVVSKLAGVKSMAEALKKYHIDVDVEKKDEEKQPASYPPDKKETRK